MCSGRAFDRAERLVEVPQPAARRRCRSTETRRKLRRKLDQDLVLEAVERREVDVAALGLDHLIVVALPEQRGDAEAGARTDDR